MGVLVFDVLDCGKVFYYFVVGVYVVYRVYGLSGKDIKLWVLGKLNCRFIFCMAWLAVFFIKLLMVVKVMIWLVCLL